MSATKAQDLKRFSKNTKDNLGSLSLASDAVKPLKNLREHSVARYGHHGAGYPACRSTQQSVSRELPSKGGST
jgi:hypothetical protein